jgi:hypothetical protein
MIGRGGWSRAAAWRVEIPPIGDASLRDFALSPSVEATLRRWQCKPLDGKARLNTAEWWQTKEAATAQQAQGCPATRKNGRSGLLKSSH